jgi:YD repeat-containing protein
VALATSKTRPYPRRTLEQALRVPRTLRDKNGGQPWAASNVAKALGLGAKSGNFFYLTSAAKQYGLTEGTSQTAEISLTDLGRRAVYPTSPEEERAALRDAFLHVASFRRVLEHYGGNKLPEKQFRENTLFTKFNLNPEVQDEFVDLLNKISRFTGIGERLDMPPRSASVTPITASAPESPGDAQTRTTRLSGDGERLIVVERWLGGRTVSGGTGTKVRQLIARTDEAMKAAVETRHVVAPEFATAIEELASCAGSLVAALESLAEALQVAEGRDAHANLTCEQADEQRLDALARLADSENAHETTRQKWDLAHRTICRTLRGTGIENEYLALLRELEARAASMSGLRSRRPDSVHEGFT